MVSSKAIQNAVNWPLERAAPASSRKPFAIASTRGRISSLSETVGRVVSGPSSLATMRAAEESCCALLRSQSRSSESGAFAKAASTPWNTDLKAAASFWQRLENASDDGVPGSQVKLAASSIAGLRIVRAASLALEECRGSSSTMLRAVGVVGTILSQTILTESVRPGQLYLGTSSGRWRPAARTFPRSDRRGASTQRGLL